MTETNVFQLSQPGAFTDQLTEVLRNGARALLAQAVEAEGPPCSAAMPTSSPMTGIAPVAPPLRREGGQPDCPPPMPRRAPVPGALRIDHIYDLCLRRRIRTSVNVSERPATAALARFRI